MICAGTSSNGWLHSSLILRQPVEFSKTYLDSITSSSVSKSPSVRARRTGEDLWKCAVDAGAKRLRPIILTSVTTIAGLLPMAMGWFGTEEFLAPMAITIVWGLVFSTIGTLFVVPCGVMLFDLVKRAFQLLVPQEPTAGGEIHSFLDVAIMALLLSPLMSTFLAIPFAIVGIVFGAKARGAIRRGPQEAAQAASGRAVSAPAKLVWTIAAWAVIVPVASVLGTGLTTESESGS